MVHTGWHIGCGGKVNNTDKSQQLTKILWFSMASWMKSLGRALMDIAANLSIFAYKCLVIWRIRSFRYSQQTIQTIDCCCQTAVSKVRSQVRKTAYRYSGTYTPSIASVGWRSSSPHQCEDYVTAIDKPICRFNKPFTFKHIHACIQ